MRKIILPIVMLCGVANADTCVRTNFTITYSCGAGTLADGQTLPTARTVDYGQVFSPQWIDQEVCTPPDGYIWAGKAIYINDEEIFYATYQPTNNYLTYFFTEDITIAPHYEHIAKPEVLAQHVHNSGGAVISKSSTDTGEWQANFYFGIVRGVAKSCDIQPDNTGSYYVVPNADTQKAIDNAAQNSGSKCYCKMTEPYLEDSPWVYMGGWGTAESCAAQCSKQLVANISNDNNRFFKPALFSAATKQLLEQAGAE